ncbi:hypothetical protein [Sneathiella litorea]|uniref:Uncharacterized protein n=1 Tax=Sneathiella litorea TaxID=2606216 RepID=A0A6L8W4Y9_9PROT|nr:hypothetical protein [Sneathiella litorea]MZR29799.1 hypothetical protein [Sneathiella litorea]
MNELFKDNTDENITFADIKRGIREAKQLRSEEVHRLLGVANAWVRKELNEIGKGVKHLGALLVHKLETMTERHQQTRAHYD